MEPLGLGDGSCCGFPALGGSLNPQGWKITAAIISLSWESMKPPGLGDYGFCNLPSSRVHETTKAGRLLLGLRVPFVVGLLPPAEHVAPLQHFEYTFEI